MCKSAQPYPHLPGRGTDVSGWRRLGTGVPWPGGRAYATAGQPATTAAGRALSRRPGRGRGSHARAWLVGAAAAGLARAGSAAGLARSPAVRAGTRQLPPAKCTGTAAGMGRNPVSGLAHASAAAGVASRPTMTGRTRGLAAIAVER